MKSKPNMSLMPIAFRVSTCRQNISETFSCDVASLSSTGDGSESSQTRHGSMYSCSQTIGHTYGCQEGDKQEREPNQALCSHSTVLLKTHAQCIQQQAPSATSCRRVVTAQQPALSPPALAAVTHRHCQVGALDLRNRGGQHLILVRSLCSSRQAGRANNSAAEDTSAWCLALHATASEKYTMFQGIQDHKAVCGKTMLPRHPMLQCTCCTPPSHTLSITGITSDEAPKE